MFKLTMVLAGSVPEALAAADRGVAHAHLGGARLAHGNLDELHDVYGVEEVHADEAAAITHARRDLRDRQ